MSFGVQVKNTYKEKLNKGENKFYELCDIVVTQIVRNSFPDTKVCIMYTWFFKCKINKNQVTQKNMILQNTALWLLKSCGI